MGNPLKVGFLNYWSDLETLRSFFINGCLKTMQSQGINVEMEAYDPTKVECDIVFHSVFGYPIQSLFRISRCLGKPIFICYSGENRLKEYKIRNNYSISFDKDSDTNLYYPIWQGEYKTYKEFSKPKNHNKSKFCTFIVSNGSSWFRNDVFNELNSYRRVDSCGTRLNNMTDGFILPRSMTESVAFHNDYKFNLCFENSKSTPNSNYITEKIVNAYTYGTVPIYWGDDEVEEWFNPKSFINCNGKSVEEIVDIVKWYDTHDKEYYEMLDQYPFNSDIDWTEYLNNRFGMFLKKILKEHGKDF